MPFNVVTLTMAALAAAGTPKLPAIVTVMGEPADTVVSGNARCGCTGIARPSSEVSVSVPDPSAKYPTASMRMRTGVVDTIRIWRFDGSPVLATMNAFSIPDGPKFWVLPAGDKPSPGATRTNPAVPLGMIVTVAARAPIFLSLIWLLYRST